MTRSHLEIGQTVNNWTITSPPIDEGGPYKYEVICRCGALGVKAKSDMRKYQYCRECHALKNSPGTLIGKRTIIEKVEGSKNSEYIVECECGRTFMGRLTNLKNHHHCNQACRMFTSDLTDSSTLSTDIHISNSHAFQFYWNCKKNGGISEEWEYDFRAFLTWYIKVVGCSISDLPTPSCVHNMITFRRISTEQVWLPGNIEVRHFFTERARDRNTYAYWKRLKSRELLDDTVIRYIDFIQVFGAKPQTYHLRRIDSSKPHSKSNSKWITGSSGDPP